MRGDEATRRGSQNLSYVASFTPRSCQEVLILDSENRWHELGVNEAIYEWIEMPSLTTKLRFKLSHAWDPVLTTMPRRLSTTINPANQPSGTDSSNHHDGSGAVPQSVEGL